MDNPIKVDIDMLFFALRYALGRQTFAPLIVMETIKNNLNSICLKDIERMAIEIESYTGEMPDIDKKQWADFVKFLERKLEEFETAPLSSGGWNHRVVRFKNKLEDEYPIQVLETYYDKEGDINGFGALTTLDSEDVRELSRLYEHIRVALTKPILVLDDDYKVVAVEESAFPK